MNDADMSVQKPVSESLANVIVSKQDVMVVLRSAEDRGVSSLRPTCTFYPSTSLIT